MPTSHRTDELLRLGEGIFLPPTPLPLGTGGGGCTYKKEFPCSSILPNFTHLKSCV